jgi:hypothetical protein
MIYISHRGNVDGPNTGKENHPDYIDEALKNYHCEIDVWFIDNQFVLGHDVPTYPVYLSFFKNKKLWCHAKNIEALNQMLKYNFHCFWHQNDDATLTSQNYIWVFPGRNIANNRSIAVCPEEANNWDISNAVGVCTDYIIKLE